VAAITVDGRLFHMHNRQWFRVVFTAESIVVWSQMVVTKEIPTHQTIVSHWQDTGVLGFDGNGKQYSQSELDVFRNLQPVQVSKQMCDMVVLPYVTYKARCSIQDGLKAVHQASRKPARVTLP